MSSTKSNIVGIVEMVGELTSSVVFNLPFAAGDAWSADTTKLLFTTISSVTRDTDSLSFFKKNPDISGKLSISRDVTFTINDPRELTSLYMQEHSTVVVEEQKSMLIENLTVLGSCTITGSFEIRDIRFQSFSTLTVVSETETCLLQNKTSTSVSPNISFNSETLVLLSNIPTNAQTITAEHHEALLAYLQHPEMLKLFNPTADMISGINDYTDEHLMEILSNTLLLAESTPVALCRIIGEYLLTEEVAIAPEFE